MQCAGWREEFLAVRSSSILLIQGFFVWWGSLRGLLVKFSQESLVILLTRLMRQRNPGLGRFHVKGPRKKVNVKKWIFFNEMWKIIGQIDDVDRFLNNSCSLGVFLAKNKKYRKMIVLKKWKLKKTRKKNLRLKNFCQISYITFL